MNDKKILKAFVSFEDTDTSKKTANLFLGGLVLFPLRLLTLKMLFANVPFYELCTY